MVDTLYAPVPPRPAPAGQQRVIEAVQSWIARGDLGRGDPLPPMRRMAESLDVDKATVCRAVASLRDRGLVHRKGKRLHVAGKAKARVDADGRAESVLANTVLVVTAADLHSGVTRRGWLGQVVEGLLGEAHARHYNAMIVHPRRIEDELAALSAARPLGIALLGVAPEARIVTRLEQAGLPLVLYGDQFEAHGHDMITPDHVQGTRDLVQWLLGRGARRILRVWSHDSRTAQRPRWLSRRDEGYQQALAEAGLPVLEAVEYVRRDLDDLDEPQRFEHRVREVAGRLVEHLAGPEPVDAIMLPTDAAVPEVAAACRLFGRTPNKDVLLAGYDNNWELCRYRAFEDTPPAATTAHDTARLGQALLQAVVERAAQPNDPPKRLTLPPAVVAVAGATNA